MTYRFVDPELNVNRVRSLGGDKRWQLPPLVRLGLLMIGYPVLICLPTHALLLPVFR